MRVIELLRDLYAIVLTGLECRKAEAIRRNEAGQ